MSWKIKRGNTSVQEIPIYTKDGELCDGQSGRPDLSTAEEIRFQVRESPNSAEIIIEKGLASGVGGISRNDPDPGYVTITIDPADTTASGVETGLYVMGLQIRWSATVIYEVILKIDGEETTEFEIEADIVRT